MREWRMQRHRVPMMRGAEISRRPRHSRGCRVRSLALVVAAFTFAMACGAGRLAYAAPVAGAPASSLQRSFDCDPESTTTIPMAQARARLKELQRSYDQLRALKGKFTQESFLSSLELSELSDGEVYFAKPGKMKWDYRAPEEQSFIVRDETLWFVQPAERQVTIDHFKTALLSELPVAFLMGIGDIEKSFELVRACERAGATLFELAPRVHGTAEGEKLRTLTLRARCAKDGACDVEGARVVDMAGNLTAIRLESMEKVDSLGAEVFAVEIPEGSDVNDRRLEGGVQ